MLPSIDSFLLLLKVNKNRFMILKPNLHCLLLPCILLFIFSSCSSNLHFTKTEKKLIHAGNADERMDLYTIQNKNDSIVLRKASKNIKKISNNPTLQLLLKRMAVTMDAEKGVGIAAPQIGINRNIFLFTRINDPHKKIQIAINPTIVRHSDSLYCFDRDGCLSVPEKSGNSKRYEWIEVKYSDENGNIHQEIFRGGQRNTDYTNIIFQHEWDHINGKLYIDKLCH